MSTFSAISAGLEDNARRRKEERVVKQQRRQELMTEINSITALMNNKNVPDEAKKGLWNGRYSKAHEELFGKPIVPEISAWEKSLGQFTKETNAILHDQSFDRKTRRSMFAAKYKEAGNDPEKLAVMESGQETLTKRDFDSDVLFRTNLKGMREEDISDEDAEKSLRLKQKPNAGSVGLEVQRLHRLGAPERQFQGVSGSAQLGATISREQIEAANQRFRGVSGSAQLSADVGRERIDAANQRARDAAADRNLASQRETKYIPVGDNKYQLMSVDEVTGKTFPIMKDGEVITLTEKEVLIAEGKKAQSLINPYETRFLSKLGESEGSRLTKLKTSALDSKESILILNEAEDLLNQGIFTGSAANIRVGFSKWLREANIYIGGRKVSNTEAYASMMGLQVGKIIKQFGSGTGLSDADREYAEKIVGGRVTVSEDAIRKLIDINRRIAEFTINEYNTQTDEARAAINERDYFQKVSIPEGRMGNPSGASVQTAESFFEKYLGGQ